jgi:hypothetical protein
MCVVQDLAQEVINEQVHLTKLGLQFLQIGAKHAALKELCDRKDAKYQAALAEFNKSTSCATFSFRTPR